MTPQGLPRPFHPDLPGMPYFVTTRTYKSRRNFLDEPARIAVSELHAQRARYGFLLLAFMDELNSYVSYVHNNPVKAGIVVDAENYAFSSASGVSQMDYERFLNEERSANNDARAGKLVPPGNSEADASRIPHP